MKKITLITLVVLLSWRGGITFAAPMGTAFTYQGRLAVGTNAANGRYDLKFTIYDALSSGSVVAGPLTNAATGVSNGLFTTTLDFGASVFTGYARWLEMGVRTNGSGAFTTLSPRQPLTPAPYSLFASNTALLNGQASSAFAPASGSTAYVTKSGDTMTGTLNLPANGLAAGGSQLVLSGGNVGIGETTPDDKLVVGQGGNLVLKGAGDDAGDIIFRTATGTQKGRVFTEPAAGQNKLYLSSGDNNADITIDAAGNVGIGQYSPSAKLDVNGTVKATGFTGDGVGLTGTGLLRTTVLDVNSIGGGSFTTTYVKVGDVGSFTKLNSGSTIEITFHGRIGVMSMTGHYAIFELRVDNAPTTNGRARALIRFGDTGNEGVNASITGIFTALSAGSHSVNFWVQTTGTGTDAHVAGGNYGTDHIVVKEFK